ncbi:MAG: branched-chain amino acid ABC transporter permease [Prochloraceae cyanobacterium]|nr:branched-chain amino acid ABC transporter permease [Prochloraceae cyanobacterium]
MKLHKNSKKQTEKKSFLKKWGGLILWILLLGFLALYPYTKVSGIQLFSATQVFMLVTLASNWNLIGGMTGYIDFGHTVFFGVGAYMMGILVTQAPLAFAPRLSFWQALPIAGLVALLLAVSLGWVTLRLKGSYFSIAMLGTFAATREIVRILRPLTGGGAGLDLPPVLNRLGEYYFMLAVMAIVVSSIWWIRRSDFGLSLLAIREDEIGAEMRGINTTLHKLVALAIAAFFTGITGAFWAWQNTYIDPDVVFLESRTVEMVMTSMLGGLGTVWGPPLGAVVLYSIQNIVWSNLLNYHLLALGILLIFLVLFMPEGILGKLGDRSSISAIRLIQRWQKRR